MGRKVTKREFLTRSSAAGAAMAATSVAASKQSRPHPPGWRGAMRVETIATNCEMCFWRCGVLAEVADGW